MIDVQGQQARSAPVGAPARGRWAAVALPPAALALGLGLWGIRRDDSLWGDEAVTYQVAHRSPGQLWQLVQHVDAVHGLYYLLMHAVFGLLPSGLVALRLPSVLGVALAAAGVALLGRRLAGPRAGLLAGLAFPVFPAVQQYAQEGRSYGLVCAGVVASGLLLLRALDRPGTGRWAGYAAVSLLTCWLHEFAVLAVLAQGVTVLAARPPRRVAACWAVALGAVLAGLAPLLWLSSGQSKQVAWITFPGTGTVLFAAGTALVGGLCAVACRRAPGTPPGPGGVSLPGFALPLLVLPQAALLLVSLVDPVYLDRYVVFEYAGLALLVGAAPARLGGRIGGWPVLLAVPAALLLLLPTELHLRTPQARPDDLAAAARAVRQLGAPGDGVLFLPSARRESALVYPADYAGLWDLALSAPVASSGTLGGVELPPATITARMDRLTRIVTVRTAGSGVPEGTRQDAAMLRVLAADFRVCARVPVRGLVVTSYARPGDCPADSTGTPPNARSSRDA
ncbi:glycosyltransferase family 39 protein [Streptacidiphilus sp. P02-A3a]|uniref:glycosyltransferase family 39 protein n=1 Tax=Streptacidiphilus sp. P02-A3a TaxID=2704468 RepID=UPI0015FA6778|nr:glycosyltransferase family 39 protein [Streptacidiphilus sp. P02-A3a]QMU68669.1 hypothetical protein GXP74_10925 [Streptacidiphilus sp. P02-A3a]